MKFMPKMLKFSRRNPEKGCILLVDREQQPMAAAFI